MHVLSIKVDPKYWKMFFEDELVEIDNPPPKRDNQEPPLVDESFYHILDHNGNRIRKRVGF